MNDDISNVRPPCKKRRVENLYHEDPEVEEMNQFRVAEFRLKRKIFVSRESEDKILNPLEDTEQAFGRDNQFWKILFRKNIFVASPFQSQTWPVILHGDDVICICDDETDRRHAFLLPALFYIRNQPTLQGPTVLCVTVTSESASMIEKEIDEFKLSGIVGGGIEKYKNSQSKDQFKIIAATFEELQQIDYDIIRSISHLVLEQVDNMSETEISWINDNIICKLPERPQIIITSIKWTNSVQQLLASKCCVNPIQVKVDGSLDLTVAIGITQKCEVVRNREDKMKKALEYLELHHKETEDKVAVFCHTEDTAIEICTALRKKEIRYKDSLVEVNDVKSEEPVFKDDRRILITNFAATDLNLDGITHLINLEFPTHIEKYIEQINRIREIKKGRDTTLISLLSEDDWPIVPDLVAVLREMKQVIAPELFYLANQFTPITHLNKSHFFEIVETDYFVDKSLMIKTIIDTSDNYLITAPRKFGKSTNLSMLDNFFNVATAEQTKTIFEKLKIGKYPDIMKDHFGQYTVLKVDMSKFKDEVTSVQTCNDALRQIIYHTYRRYKGLFDKQNDEHTTFLNWCDKNACKQLPNDEIRSALNQLAMFLHERYGKQVILICDEFDAICNAVLSNSIYNDKGFLSTYREKLSESTDNRTASESTDNRTASESIDTEAASKFILRKALAEEIMTDRLDAIIRAYFEIFADLVKTDDITVDVPMTAEKRKLQSIVYKSIFSGVTAITCSGASPLNTLPQYRFLENGSFDRFYGITIEEFDTLLEKQVFEKLREERDQVLEFYNGYQTVNNDCILCTHSLCSYLCNVYQKPKIRLQSYWISSGSVKRYTDVWKRSSMRERLVAVISNTDFIVRKFSNICATDLAQMTVICDSEDYEVTQMDILFTYLQQLGYLTIKDSKAWLLRVPNEEIRAEFVDILVKSIQLCFNVEFSVLKECSKYFTQLVNDDKVTESLVKIGEGLSYLCKKRPTDEKGTLQINEATVEHLVYAMLLVSKFHVQSQIKVEREGVTNRNALKILDLCFYRWNFGVVIELKYGSGTQKTPQAALMQIKNKGYGNVLKNCQIPMKIIKAMYIGIQVTEKGEATLDYTNDIENFSC